MMKRSTHLQPVGVFAGMAVGSQLTQSTLNTFHMAGINDELVSKGVNRIQEILNNSTSLTRTKFEFSLNCINVDANKITEIKMEQIVENVDKIENFPEWTIEYEQEFGKINFDENENCLFVQVVLSLSKMSKCQTSVEEVFYSNFPQNWNFVAASRACDGIINLLFCVKIEPLKNCHLSKNLSQDLINYYILSRQEIPLFLSSVVKGIVHVISSSIQQSKILMIANSKLSLENVCRLMIGKFDIVCSKAEDMLRVFGIEVARICIINELIKIMDGILPCHICVVVDFMTCTGIIKPLNRYTIRSSNSPLYRMSFEEATRNLTFACQNGEVDELKTISSRVITSKKIY